MVYQHWNRKPNEFEDFELEFFTENHIANPKRIIVSTALDAMARREDSHGYYLDSDLLAPGGCYLFFDSYQSDKKSELLPLYVGRSNCLKNRLYKHWRNTENFIDEYQEKIFSNDPQFLRTDAELLVRNATEAYPIGIPWVAFWYEDVERERMFLEHELIFKCRPVFNRT